MHKVRLGMMPICSERPHTRSRQVVRATLPGSTPLPSLIQASTPCKQEKKNVPLFIEGRMTPTPVPGPQECFVPPIADPLTFVQSMLSSSFSSTSPTEQTLSPRTRYRPSGISVDSSESSGSRIMRSVALLST